MKAIALSLLTMANSVLAFTPETSTHRAFNTVRGLLLQPAAPPSVLTPTSLWLAGSSYEENTAAAPTLSKSETILNEFHQSNLTFRIVVIGNGAILETTSKLGPKTSSSISPKTGDKLMTFASEDASFEFHVKVEQVCMITFVATERPDKVMRVSRFLSEKGTPICSLILADNTPEAVSWFESMVEKYGNEAIM
jgi:hypothetical protein